MVKALTSILVDPKKWAEFKRYSIQKGKSMSSMIDGYIGNQIANENLDDFTKLEDKTNPRLFIEIEQIKEYLTTLKTEEIKAVSWKLNEWGGFLKEL